MSSSRTRVQELADLISATRDQMGAVNQKRVEIQVKLNALDDRQRKLNATLIAAYREMDKQVAGPTLNT